MNLYHKNISSPLFISNTSKTCSPNHNKNQYLLDTNENPIAIRKKCKISCKIFAFCTMNEWEDSAKMYFFTVAAYFGGCSCCCSCCSASIGVRARAAFYCVMWWWLYGGWRYFCWHALRIIIVLYTGLMCICYGWFSDDLVYLWLCLSFVSVNLSNRRRSRGGGKVGGSGCCLSVCFVVFQVYTTPSVDVLVVVDLYEEIDRRFFFYRERKTNARNWRWIGVWCCFRDVVLYTLGWLYVSTEHMYYM